MALRLHRSVVLCLGGCDSFSSFRMIVWWLQYPRGTIGVVRLSHVIEFLSTLVLIPSALIESCPKITR
jgi:hypothetical protein